MSPVLWVILTFTVTTHRRQHRPDKISFAMEPARIEAQEGFEDRVGFHQALENKNLKRSSLLAGCRSPSVSLQRGVHLSLWVLLSGFSRLLFWVTSKTPQSILITGPSVSPVGCKVALSPDKKERAGDQQCSLKT